MAKQYKADKELAQAIKERDELQAAYDAGNTECTQQLIWAIHHVADCERRAEANRKARERSKGIREAYASVGMKRTRYGTYE